MNQIIFEIAQEFNAAYGLEWDEEIKRLFAETVIVECLDYLYARAVDGKYLSKDNLVKRFVET
jgi:hypothetical protein